MSIPIYAKAILDAFLSYNFHMYILFCLLMLASFQESLAHLDGVSVLVSLSFTCCIVFYTLINKLSTLRFEKANYKKNPLLKLQKYTLLFFALYLLILPLFALYSSWKMISLYTFTAVLGLSYSTALFKEPLKKIFLVKNICIALIWAVPVALAPMVLKGQALLSNLDDLLIVLFMVMAVSILYDVRDIEDDFKHRIKTIPNTLGVDKTKKILFGFLILISLLMWIFQFSVYEQLILIPLAGFTAFLSEKRSAYFYHAILFVWIIIQAFILLVNSH